MKTVLVTGAGGALGRAVVARLNKMENVHLVATVHRQDNQGSIALDLLDGDAINSIVERIKPDLVLHLAATFSTEFDEAYAVNVGAARHFLDAIRRHCADSRILLIGSAAEYGAVHPEENPLREDHALNPVSVYGLTKAWQSQLGILQANNGVDVVIARIFNINGPGQSERLFIGRLQKQIAELLSGEKDAIELGPLSAIRDYISTDEAVDQILAIAFHGLTGQAYHVASGSPVTMRDILGSYLAAHEIDISTVKIGPKLTNRAGYDVPVIFADISRTAKLMELWGVCAKS